MPTRVFVVSVFCSTIFAIGCDPVQPIIPPEGQAPTVEPQNIQGIEELKALGAADPTLDDEGYVTGIVFAPGSTVRDGDLTILKQFERLEELNLKRAKITDNGLLFVADRKNLTTLVLSGTEITGSGLGHVVGLTKLERLHLDETAVDDDGLVHIAGMTDIYELWLSDTQVTDEGLKRIAGLTNLRELTLARNAGITDVSQTVLERFTKLKWLNIFDTGITEATAEVLRMKLPTADVRH